MNNELLGIIETIEDVVKRQRFKWFGHVVRSGEETLINACCKHDFTNARPRGRPPKWWSDNIREQSGLPLLTVEAWKGPSNVEEGRRALGSEGTTNPVQLVVVVCISTMI